MRVDRLCFVLSHGYKVGSICLQGVGDISKHVVTIQSAKMDSAASQMEIPIGLESRKGKRNDAFHHVKLQFDYSFVQEKCSLRLPD